MRMPLSLRSISGVPSSQALSGYLIIARHLCAFLLYLVRELCGGTTPKKKKTRTKRNKLGSADSAERRIAKIESCRELCWKFARFWLKRDLCGPGKIQGTAQAPNTLPSILQAPSPNYPRTGTNQQGTLSHCINKRQSLLQTPPHRSPKITTNMAPRHPSPHPNTHSNTCTTCHPPCNPPSSVLTLSPLTRGTDTDKRAFSFFLFSSSVSRHRALSYCPRRTPSP